MTLRTCAPADVLTTVSRSDAMAELETLTARSSRMRTAPPRRASGAAPSTVASAPAPSARPRRRGRADAGPFWLIRGKLTAC